MTVSKNVLRFETGGVASNNPLRFVVVVDSSSRGQSHSNCAMVLLPTIAPFCWFSAAWKWLFPVLCDDHRCSLVQSSSTTTPSSPKVKVYLLKYVCQINNTCATPGQIMIGEILFELNLCHELLGSFSLVGACMDWRDYGWGLNYV